MKLLRLPLALLLAARPLAPAFAAGVNAPAPPTAAFRVTALRFDLPATRGAFFAELDKQLAAIERSFDPADLGALAEHLNASLARIGSFEELAARQVLLGALLHPDLRADVEGTLRFAAKGAKSDREQATAERLAALARKVEAANDGGKLGGGLSALQKELFGGAGAESARDAVGPHLDALFDGTPALAEGAPVYQEPGARQDEFGRTNGWEDAPPEPADAPKTLAEVTIEPPLGAVKRASPADWRDQVFYYVMLDRFGRVLPAAAWGDPHDARTRHGGNVKGLIAELDYLQGIASTIVISPIVMNTPAAYHGYSPIHRMAVEPALGTMADIETLRKEMEKRDMRLIIDRVFNQTGPILKYKDGFKYSQTPKEVERIHYPLKPAEYIEGVNENFSRRGDIDDWNSEEQKQNGDLPGGIPHVNLANPSTQDLMLKETKWWMMKTGEDGERLDAYPHVARAFWDRLFAEGAEYAAQALGKENYLFLGELFEGDPRKYVNELKEGRLGAAYNYVSYYWNDQALHGRAPTRVLEESFHKLSAILGPAIHRLVNFLSNHDRLHFLGPEDPVGILHFALAYIFTSIGIPYLYGEEQAPRRVPGRKWLDIEAAREDRFEGGKFTNPASAGHSFDTQSDGYRLVRKLKSIRDAHAALRRGEQYIRWSDPRGPGIFAFSRIYEGEEVLVVLNSAPESRNAEMWVDAGLSRHGVTLTDELDSAYSVEVRSSWWGSKVTVDVPPHGTRILTRRIPGLVEIKLESGTNEGSTPYAAARAFFNDRSSMDQAASQGWLPKKVEGADGQTYGVVPRLTDAAHALEIERFAEEVRHQFSAVSGVAETALDAGAAGSEPDAAIRVRFRSAEAMSSAKDLPKYVKSPDGTKYRVTRQLIPEAYAREEFKNVAGIVTLTVGDRKIRVRFASRSALEAADLPKVLTTPDVGQYEVIRELDEPR